MYKTHIEEMYDEFLHDTADQRAAWDQWQKYVEKEFGPKWNWSLDDSDWITDKYHQIAWVSLCQEKKGRWPTQKQFASRVNELRALMKKVEEIETERARLDGEIVETKNQFRKITATYVGYTEHFWAGMYMRK